MNLLNLDLDLAPRESRKARSAFFCFKEPKTVHQTIQDHFRAPESMSITGVVDERLYLLILLKRSGISHIEIYVNSFLTWKNMKKNQNRCK